MPACRRRRVYCNNDDVKCNLAIFHIEFVRNRTEASISFELFRYHRSNRTVFGYFTAVAADLNSKRCTIYNIIQLLDWRYGRTPVVLADREISWFRYRNSLISFFVAVAQVVFTYPLENRLYRLAVSNSTLVTIAYLLRRVAKINYTVIIIKNRKWTLCCNFTKNIRFT